MTINLREMRAEDVVRCGTICYEAFKGISEAHNFRPDFPSADSAIEFTQSLLQSPFMFNVVADDGRAVIGSNHLWEYDEIRAVGPITVAAEAQSKGIGRQLMEAVIERGRGSASIRLVQDAFNSKSMSLYASLGFDVKEPLVLMEGSVAAEVRVGLEVRVMKAGDLDACAALCRNVHGFDRTNEIQNIPPFLSSFVARRDGHVVAYAAAPHFWALNHAVARTNDDMEQLLAGISASNPNCPISFLLPTRQGELFRWCLKQGMRVVKPMNLMSMGQYNEPKGAFLPSVGY